MGKTSSGGLGVFSLRFFGASLACVRSDSRFYTDCSILVDF